MDALTFLRGEHNTMFDMLVLVDGLPHRARAGSGALDVIVRDLISAETRRERIEQELFWPAVRSALVDGNALADRALAQQESGKKLRQRLAESKPGERDFDDALTEFVATTRERMIDEQGLVWPRFAVAVDPAELADLGEQLERAHNTAPPRSLT